MESRPKSRARFFSRRLLLGTLLTGWVVAVSAVMVALHARHTLSLQTPQAGVVAGLQTDHPSQLFHVLSMECGCSKNVLRGLLQRPASRQWQETVLLLAPETASTADDQKEWNSIESRLAKNGYRVHFADQSESFPIPGVPALMAFRDRKLTYSGGYSQARITRAEDLVLEPLLAELESGLISKPRPIFGCAVSKSIRQMQKPEEWFNSFTQLALSDRGQNE